MEDQGQGKFTKAIQLQDGHKINVEVKQKRQNCKKRKVKTWSLEQDQQLLALYEQYPKKWATIASNMNNRNQNQCLHRYRRITKNGVHKKIWSAEEDNAIKKMMKKVGKNWKLLSQMIGTKTGKQIRERFINKLDPKIKQEEWSDQQDRKIIELYCQVGRKWSIISKQLPGRPQNKIKNRFYSYIQKNYDIKCKSVDKQSEQSEQMNQNSQEIQREEKINQKNELRTSFKDIYNQMPRNISSRGDTLKEDKCASFILPSINNLDFQMKSEDFADQNACKRSKQVIGSMIKIEDEWAGNKDKDCYSFGPNAEFQNDFFYLSGN